MEEKGGGGVEYWRLFDCTLFIQQRCRWREGAQRAGSRPWHNQNDSVCIFHIPPTAPRSLLAYILSGCGMNARAYLCIEIRRKRHSCWSNRQRLDVREAVSGTVSHAVLSASVDLAADASLKETKHIWIKMLILNKNRPSYDNFLELIKVSGAPPPFFFSLFLVSVIPTWCCTHLLLKFNLSH